MRIVFRRREYKAVVTVSVYIGICNVKARLTKPIASPIMKTSVWSAIADGFVRKKKARVM